MKLNKILKFGLPILGVAAIAITLPVALTSCGSSKNNANGSSDNVNGSNNNANTSNEDCLNLINDSFKDPVTPPEGSSNWNLEGAEKDYDATFKNEFIETDLEKDLNTWCFGIEKNNCENWSKSDDARAMNDEEEPNANLLERTFETYDLEISNFNKDDKSFSFVWKTYDYMQYSNSATESNEIPKNYDFSSWLSDTNVLSQMCVETTYKFENVKIVPKLYQFENGYVSGWAIQSIGSLKFEGKVNVIKSNDLTPINKQTEKEMKEQNISKSFNEITINQDMSSTDFSREEWSTNSILEPLTESKDSNKVELDAIEVLSPSLNLLYIIKNS